MTVEAAPASARSGVRVVVDARPMQEPERSPLTAWYLARLLGAFAQQPVPDDSFVLVSRALRDDPAAELAVAGLPVAGSRRVPPTTRALRAAGLTLDSFLLRGAEVGVTDDADATVFHTAGGAVPIASRLPVVATLLDLAPWELPDAYAASAAARFGHRLRARVLRDAARVICCSRAVAENARRLLHVPPERLAVVPLAVDPDFLAAAHAGVATAAAREELRLPPHYVAFVGRYDARKDLATLLSALAVLRAGAGEGAPSGRRRANGAPALVLGLEAASANDLARAERLVERHRAAASVTLIVVRGAAQRAAIVAGADAVVVPALSDATGVAAIEALAAGVPVICSRAGALPETVGSAGIVVEPRDPNRMAAALEAMAAGGSLAQQLRRQARRRSAAVAQRTWLSVADETRAVYEAAAAARARPEATAPTRARSIFDRIAVR